MDDDENRNDIVRFPATAADPAADPPVLPPAQRSDAPKQQICKKRDEEGQRNLQRVR